MALPVTCSCGAEFKVKEALAGKRVKCPKCARAVAVAAAEAESKEDPSCPACGAAMEEHAILCLDCGYNVRTGKKMSSPKPAPKTPPKLCVHCGLKLEPGNPTCPYCQADNTDQDPRASKKKQRKKTEYLEEEFSRLRRVFYFTPGVGLLTAGLLGFMLQSEIRPGQNLPMGYYLGIGALLPAFAYPEYCRRAFRQTVRDRDNENRFSWYKRETLLYLLMGLATLGVNFGVLFLINSGYFK